MLHFMCKRVVLFSLLLSNPHRRNAIVGDSTTQQTIIQSLLATKSFSSKMSSPTRRNKQPHSFTVSYLINSCGLSPETAISASKRVHFENPDRPDSVLTLLRNHGFTNTHISKIVVKEPLLLVINAEKILLPKLKFFLSIGTSSADMTLILSKTPRMLLFSLENRLFPTYNFLKSVVCLDENFVSVLKRSSWIFSQDVQKNIAPNISVLRGHGVPQSFISKFVCLQPRAITIQALKFERSVKEINKMGFNPLKWTFLEAIHAVLIMSKSTWKRKIEVYTRWGWSEDEIWLAFRKHPICMKLSEENIMNCMDYLVNKMGWQPAAIAKCPVVLSYSLEKRIIPRSLVVKVLMLKCLIKKDMSLYSVFYGSEKYFLDKYVTRYQEHVPQLLNVYQGKMDLLEAGFESDKICGTNHL